MENKYFVPEIEDIRVGYECEIRPTGFNREWEHHIIGGDECMSSFVSLGNKYIGYGSPSIRVPYLTKEQIEAEGWIWWGSEENGFYRHVESESDTFVNIDERTHRARFRVGIGQVPEWTVYDGECKDINTFRYICKLLNICA